jgi:hypothetical protein
LVLVLWQFFFHRLAAKTQFFSMLRLTEEPKPTLSALVCTLIPVAALRYGRTQAKKIHSRKGVLLDEI